MPSSSIPVADLVRAGLVVNLHMWLGPGFLYCPGCRRHTYHFAMSHPGQRDCWEVCRGCRSYHGNQELPLKLADTQREVQECGH